MIGINQSAILTKDVLRSYEKGLNEIGYSVSGYNPVTPDYFYSFSVLDCRSGLEITVHVVKEVTNIVNGEVKSKSGIFEISFIDDFFVCVYYSDLYEAVCGILESEYTDVDVLNSGIAYK